MGWIAWRCQGSCLLACTAGVVDQSPLLHRLRPKASPCSSTSLPLNAPPPTCLQGTWTSASVCWRQGLT